MLDTMTFTKVAGGLLGALLIYLLGGFVGGQLYTTGGGHGHEAQAYVIETGGEAAEEEEAPDFATVLASADAGKGERVFGKCKACHKVDGTNSTGPHLDGVVGRAAASVDGFGYSQALQDIAGQEWTPEHLQEFLTSPKGYAPGTAMSFAGLSKIEDRANVIAYLETLQ